MEKTATEKLREIYHDLGRDVIDGPHWKTRVRDLMKERGVSINMSVVYRLRREMLDNPPANGKPGVVVRPADSNIPMEGESVAFAELEAVAAVLRKVGGADRLNRIVAGLEKAGFKV